MTSKNKLILKIEGPERNGRHLELSVFVEKARQFDAFLKASAKDIGADGAVFDVVALSHSSPALICCVPASRSIGDIPPSAIVNCVKEKLDLAQEKQTRKFSHPVLDSLEKLVNHNPKKIHTIEIQAVDGDDDNAKRYQLDEEFKQNLRDARSRESRDISTVDGKLEQINIHKNANTFKIYTFASPVICKFPKNLLSSVQGALGRFVSVSGECHYRPDADFPYKINVQEMEVLPPTEELPSLFDIRGIAPGATGGKSSEQFVRELREEWDRDIR